MPSWRNLPTGKTLDRCPSPSGAASALVLFRREWRRPKLGSAYGPRTRLPIVANTGRAAPSECRLPHPGSVRLPFPEAPAASSPQKDGARVASRNVGKNPSTTKAQSSAGGYHPTFKPFAMSHVCKSVSPTPRAALLTCAPPSATPRILPTATCAARPTRVARLDGRVSGRTHPGRSARDTVLADVGRSSLRKLGGSERGAAAVLRTSGLSWRERWARPRRARP
jgi:hypothetical protein